MNYLFVSSDPYHTEKAVTELKKKLLGDDAFGLNCSFFEAGHDSIDEAVSVLRTTPFGSEHRLVILKKAEELSEKESALITSYLKNPARCSTLVLDAGDKVPRNKIWEEMGKYVKEVSFDEDNKKKLNSLIDMELKALKKTIAPDAAALIKELKGEDDMLGVKNELEKLSVFTGDRSEISKSDVELMVGKTIDGNVFRLLDAIVAKDPARVLKILSELWEVRAQPHEILGLLAWHYRKMRVGAGNSASARKRMKRNVNILLSADSTLKSSACDPRIALETAIFKLF